MLLCLLPVALTLAALAADGAEAPERSGLSVYSDDPMTRRSTSYIRFGRGGLQDASRWTKRLDPHFVRRNDFIRLSRSNKNGYIRFGRAGKHATPWQHYDDDVLDDHQVDVRFAIAAGAADDDGDDNDNRP
ncbi:Hypothetical protein CINCED_3A015523 [Cinara cedri]|uniref:Uncharacterized protein n=1 Tax=Cinara cedri TaxID=506608 RepID=A0A5E4NSK4_9HEMI|nr:Hypothetical protein CINCED_3A015523 [Cinara cedri]